MKKRNGFRTIERVTRWHSSSFIFPFRAMPVKVPVIPTLPVSEHHGTEQNNGSVDAFQISVQAGTNSLISDC
jgi:hypothetical protein